MVWPHDAATPSSIPAILLHRDYFRHRARPPRRRRRRGKFRAHAHTRMRIIVGDRFVKKDRTRTGNRAMCILITLPDIFNIPRVWTSLIGSICFPFWRSDYDRYWVFGYFSRLRFRLPSPHLCHYSPQFPSSPLRYGSASLPGSIPGIDLLDTRSRTRLLSSNICSYVPTVSSRETIWLSLIRRSPFLRSFDVRERSLFSMT